MARMTDAEFRLLKETDGYLTGVPFKPGTDRLPGGEPQVARACLERGWLLETAPRGVRMARLTVAGRAALQAEEVRRNGGAP